MQMVSGFSYTLLVLWICFWCLVIAFLILMVKERQRGLRQRGLIP